MKKIIVLALLLLASISKPSEGFAAASEPNNGPEIIKFKMGELTLPFKHWLHIKALNSECKPCHPNKIGKIEDWGENTAHLLCISCHKGQKKGPTECEKCHVNIYSKM